jgi:hypothetical protein
MPTWRYGVWVRDADVRAALKAQLLDEHAAELADTLVLDELGLCGEARVDVALVNGSLSGYELKSARDTLERLPNQARVYGQVVDYAYLVVADRHLRKARAMLPRWWGLIVASDTDSGVRLDPRRESTRNPRVQPGSLVQLLWRDEALAIAARLGIDAGIRSKPREVIWMRLSAMLELDDLRREVRTALRGRRGWRESPAQRGSAATLQRASTSPRFLARRLR